LETVGRDGASIAVDLDLAAAMKLYIDAVAALPPALKFEKAAGEAIAELKPSPKLADLVKKSRALSAAATDDGGE